MDPSIISDLPEEPRKAIETNFASYAAGLLSAQQEDRAASREEDVKRDRERVHAQESEPRSSAVQSQEQFPQDYARAQQQEWAAVPQPGRAEPSVFERTDIGLGNWTAKEWRDVEDGELMWMEEGRRVEEQELVLVEKRAGQLQATAPPQRTPPSPPQPHATEVVEKESPLPPLWTEEPGWWLDRVPSETPPPISPLKLVNMERDQHETAGKEVMVVVVEKTMDDGGCGSEIQREHQEEKEEPGGRKEHWWESEVTQQQQQPEPLPSSPPPTPLPSSPMLPSVPPSLPRPLLPQQHAIHEQQQRQPKRPPSLGEQERECAQVNRSRRTRKTVWVGRRARVIGWGSEESRKRRLRPLRERLRAKEKITHR